MITVRDLEKLRSKHPDGRRSLVEAEIIVRSPSGSVEIYRSGQDVEVLGDRLLTLPDLLPG
jgi:DUF971 family protein